MANLFKVTEQNTLQPLAARGWLHRRIARELKIDRKTVRRYLHETGCIAPGYWMRAQPLFAPAAPLCIRSLEGHRVLAPVISQGDMANDMFGRQ
jgi:hypothetical protein